MDNNRSPFQVLPGPKIERVRHELKRRSLTVVSIVDVTPAMRRITLTGDALEDFTSLAPDDHIKIIVPAGDGAEERRDYTPRRYDRTARTLTIDFALHDAGPVTQWAIAANPGDSLEIGGPRGSAVVSDSVKRWLLIGDETALPAIGRRLEEAGVETTITVVAAVAGPLEQQTFDTQAALTCDWVHRPLSDATDVTGLLDSLARVDIHPETFIWIAAEASVARAVREYLTKQRDYPLSWIKASGYWVQGKADATEKFD
ncbi:MULTISPECIES: siderophore-interacting protein [unclassified Sinorhizobium]|uniref:siderophore-interacting protein n=1 Tax=unclassified Sinorhizobium TaxID=2613772 RepID=UPI0035264C6D